MRLQVGALRRGEDHDGQQLVGEGFGRPQAKPGWG